MSSPSPRTVPLVVGALVLLTLAGAGVVAWQRGQDAGQSDVIVEPWDALGGAVWLKPDLDDAHVVLPDRPHSRAEVEASRDGTQHVMDRTRSYKVSSGSQRLRCGDPGPKPARRIIALGDSVTHGWGVTCDQSYPGQLQALLQERGQDVDVINAGVPANRVQTMQTWCERMAPALEPDVVVWTRRPEPWDPPPYRAYQNGVKACERATGAKLVVALPPISSFDAHGQAVWQQEYQALSQALEPQGVAVVELTPGFATAREGKGDVLKVEGDEVVVIDQDSGKELLRAPRTREDLHPDVYALFEAEPSVREHLFFDSGHPDAAGFTLFAELVAEAL